ncbi:endoplasmic reticulum retention protein [Glugoides intestinalis]
MSQFIRYLGDFFAISSKIAIARKVKRTNSLSGLSLKTQILYLIIYILRYVNVLTIKGFNQPKDVYNAIMKVVYISFQIYIISLFYGKLKFSYSKKYDTFSIDIFLAVSVVLAWFFKDGPDSIFEDFFRYVFELFYACSLILESLAILPQLVMIQDSEECEKLTALFITLNGIYRFVYLIYFIRLIIGGTKVDELIVITSLIQSVLYIDFFRIYFKNWNVFNKL